MRAGPTILVAEDDDDVRGAIVCILEEDGFRTLAAANGAEALALVIAQRPDAVLLDMNMPVVSGRDFLERRRLDASIAAIPVVAITACQLSGVPAGAAALLRKPFDLEEFRGAIAAARISAGEGWRAQQDSNLRPSDS